jgi:prophage regulatory protein
VTQAILRLPAVKKRTGLSRSSIYMQMSEGTFPKAIHIGVRAIGWVDEQIDGWVQTKIEEARGRRP